MERAPTKGLQARFMKVLAANWAATFPFLKPHESRKRTYVDSRFDKERDRIYEFEIQFNSKSTEQSFTVNITVRMACKPFKPVFHAFRDETTTETSEGVYRIGNYMPSRQGDFWWLLSPVPSLFGGALEETAQILDWHKTDRKRYWYPQDWSIPEEEIFSKAIKHLNSSMCKYVLTALKLDGTK